MHALLAHLEGTGFMGAPRPLGFDEQGREVLTFLEDESVGYRRPRPAWVHAEDTLDQVARWIRAFHQAVARLRLPSAPSGAGAATWSPGLIIAHNDAATRQCRLASGQGAPGDYRKSGWGQASRRTAISSPPQGLGGLLRQGIPDALDQAVIDSPASRDSALSEPVPPGRVRKPDNCHSAHSMRHGCPAGLLSDQCQCKVSGHT